MHEEMGSAKTSVTAAALKVVIVIALWGDEFIDKFFQVSLPTLLAAGNLPAVVNLVPCRFLIVTSQGDILRLKSDPLFLQLSKLLQVNFATLNPGEERYRALSQAHMIAAQSAIENEEAAIFFSPDAIIADGGLSHVIGMALQGCRAVMCTGLRLVEEAMMPLLLAMPRGENGALTLTPREMTKIALANFHPEIEQYVWGSRNFTRFPHLCMWRGPERDGFLLRAFHLHPLLVNFSGVSGIIDFERSTIDGDFVGQIIGRWSDIGVVDDSDDVSVYSLTPSDQRHKYRTYGPSNEDGLRAMAYSHHVNPLHRFYFTRAIRIHSEDTSDQWVKLEEETGRVAYRALDLNMGKRFDAIIQQMSGRDLVQALTERIYRKLKLSSSSGQPR
jgi:hypothetical protein